MQSYRLQLPRPHPGQREVFAQHKRFNVLCCGRRWGKTLAGMDIVVRAALAGRPVGWFSPTYKYLSDAWRELCSTLNPVTVSRDATEHRLSLIGGGSVEGWTMDHPNAGRGRAYATIVVDEAAMVRDLEQSWTQSVRPTLTDYAGDAWFLSTPQGVANYFYALYQRGQDPEYPDWASWRALSKSNPFLPAEEIESARQDLTELAFAQEYLAEFVTWTGAVFRRITDAVQPINPTFAHMIGVDWGRVNDYTVFVAVSAEGHVVGIERSRGVEYEIQRGRLAEFWKRMGSRARILAEQNSVGEVIIGQLQRDGLPVHPFQTTGASKAAIIDALVLAFERGTIRIPNDAALIGELQAFEAVKTPSGMMRYSAPEGLHDDMVMALAFAWAGLVAGVPQQQYWDPAQAGIVDTYRPYQISPI